MVILARGQADKRETGSPGDVTRQMSSNRG